MKSVSTETGSSIDYCLIGSAYGARPKITTNWGVASVNTSPGLEVYEPV